MGMPTRLLWRVGVFKAMKDRSGHECRTAGFSIIELLAVLAVLGIVSALVVPQLIMAYERSRQRRSIADLRSIAVANGTYRVDNNLYAGSFPDLSPVFMNPVPPVDAWGTAWSYTGGGATYTVSSLGSDSAAGPAPPALWYDEPFESDLVLVNGTFTQAPATR